LKVPVEYTEGGGKGRLGDGRGGKDEGTPGFVAIPKRYRKPDMKHLLKFIEELPSEEHHRLKFCGLEANLPNSYCNAMLQVFIYIYLY
jgi:PAB-dependent poly(A)-specific ribonuclease subunit 2